jgi:hypothetical protein
MNEYIQRTVTYCVHLVGILISNGKLHDKCCNCLSIVMYTFLSSAIIPLLHMFSTFVTTRQVVMKRR